VGPDHVSMSLDIGEFVTYVYSKFLCIGILIIIILVNGLKIVSFSISGNFSETRPCIYVNQKLYNVMKQDYICEQ
jgi:hypothetical protein